MKLYSNIKTKNTYFEIWGGSTKHPDVRRVLQYDTEEGRFFPSEWITTPEYEFFQWALQCISELSFGTYYHTQELMEMCEEYFETHNNSFF